MEAIRAYVRGNELSAATRTLATRFALEEFASRHPGKSVEIRIPWVGAVQAVAGPVHTRGTPANVVEMDAETWLALVTGKPTDGQITMSGTRADLSGYLPLFGPVSELPSEE
ncbi:MAG: hypothetical protein GX483_03600 [Actinomycetaceae bacterium]|nr:hypothetical protein [Actinomycetaceae bacterium]